MADEREFQVKIITPDRLFYEGTVSMLEMVTTEGEMGIYKHHIPLTAIIAPGILKLHEADEVRVAALHSGFVVVMPEEITVLADAVEWPDEIDTNRAEEARIRAERRLKSETSGEIDTVRAEMALRRSLTRLQVAGKR